jgi:hypothetical protein
VQPFASLDHEEDAYLLPVVNLRAPFLLRLGDPLLHAATARHGPGRLEIGVQVAKGCGLPDRRSALREAGADLLRLAVACVRGVRDEREDDEDEFQQGSGLLIASSVTNSVSPSLDRGG